MKSESSLKCRIIFIISFHQSFTCKSNAAQLSQEEHYAADPNKSEKQSTLNVDHENISDEENSRPKDLFIKIGQFIWKLCLSKEEKKHEMDVFGGPTIKMRL